MIRIALALVIAAITALAGCHDVRQDTLRAELVTLTTTRDEFVAWDLKHQTAMIEAIKAKGGTREMAEAAVAVYQSTVQAVVLRLFGKAFEEIAKAAIAEDPGDRQLDKAAGFIQQLLGLVHGRSPAEDLPALPAAP